MKYFYCFACLLLVVSKPFTGKAQLLAKQVTVDADNKPVSQVLKTIGAQGGFYFSYNNNIINKDSIITIHAQNKTVHEVLDMLFDGGYEYKETGKYVILQKASGQYWYATGRIVDATSGEGIPYASVYSKEQLASTLTDDKGYFKLKLKDRSSSVVITISKTSYKDTVVVVRGGISHEITVGISIQPLQMDEFVVNQHDGIEKTWFGRFFLSSKQRMQSLNIGKYFVNKPYQGSIVPGLGTHGKMSGQVVNKFSFNMLGGYSAGVNGFEMGGVFNIVKNDVRYAQLSGLFNMAGGKLNGIQVAGAYNQVLQASKGWQLAGLCNFINDTLNGVQVTGAYNHVWGKLEGAQVSGMANLVRDNIEGAQIAGAVNYANKQITGAQVSGMVNVAMGEIHGTQITGAVNYAHDDVEGVQVAGMVNAARKTVEGTQVSGFMNYAGRLHGVQVGVMNIADSSSGVSVGLFNFVVKGYHKLCISTNETQNLSVDFKTGNNKLYNIFIGGMNVGTSARTFSLGYGWGSAIKLGKKLSLNPEVTGEYIYLGDWDYVNTLAKLRLNVHLQLNKFIGLYAGPSLAAYYSNQTVFTGGYKTDVARSGFFNAAHQNNINTWVGWTAGVSFF